MLKSPDDVSKIGKYERFWPYDSGIFLSPFHYPFFIHSSQKLQ